MRSNSMINTAKKIYASILVISSRILYGQSACVESQLADARCLLWCLCVAAMLEASYEMLSMFIILKL